MGYSAGGLGVTGARAPDADHMGERGYRVVRAPSRHFTGAP